ncbi:unnamed protein product [Paramecium primaurelia]|uniref:Uncharacterized protein n=1 Tax=Paramecium primaurelia TaxID=5886 RepID=A0A8S1L274_PARPR|nr:unnamed protein product [Paramecium primaurelia]
MDNLILLYLTAWFIDNWTNQEFIIKLDNQIIYQVSYQPTKAISNLFYSSANDYIEEINLSIVHTQNSAQLTFQTTLLISAYEASLAISNIYILIDYCDNNCDVCSNTQCTLCKNPYQLIHNQCSLCDSSNFRNYDCSCQTGFYDDNINKQCQKCKQECETCLNANSCTQCKLGTNLIILPNCMNCNTGFYYNNGICSRCSKNCLACFGSGQSECLSCQTDYILNNNNECQSCMSNQFIYNNTCQDCQYNCETCNNTQQCLTCTENRINVPFCICQIGYYESNTKSCQSCSFQCSTCQTQRDNCLTCSGNRQNPPLCTCPDDSDLNDSNIWCTDCSIVNLEVKMSSNAKKIIINFGRKISKISSDCSALFEQSTLQNLGNNPSCFVNSQSIQVLLGQNTTTYFGLPINFKKNIIKFQDCQNTLSLFLNNILSNNQDIQAPSIIFSKNLVQLTACTNTPEVIYQIQTQNFGSNQITFIDWKLNRVSQHDPNITQLLDNLKSQFKNQNQIVMFEFSNDILQMENEILLELQYKNFLGIQGSSLITIKQLTTKLFLNVQQQRNQYMISQLIEISIQVSHCSDILTNDAKFNLSTIIGTLKKQVEIVLGDYYIYTIEPYLLNAGLYKLNVQLSNEESLEIEQNFQILIANEQPQIQLVSESNVQSYQQKLIIYGKVINLVQQDQLFSWDCFDIIQNSECKTQNQTILILPNSQNLTLQPYSLNPFSVYMFTARFQDLQQQITITIVESNVPKIEYKSYPNIADGYINYYDQLLFKFKYLEIVQNPDLLLYTGILSNSDILIKHFKFNYLELQISLWHYFTVEELTKQMTLKINIYNPDYFLPSQVTIPLNINIPPLQCRIDFDQQNAFTISNFQIRINNCKDDNFPLQYRLVLYFNNSDLNFDYSINTIQKGIILVDYQYSNLFHTKLTGNGNIQLMVQVKDNLNGISNYTKSLDFVYQQGFLDQILLNQTSISETLIYTASLQFEESFNSQEISQFLQEQIMYFSNCKCITQKQLLNLKTLAVNHKKWALNDINNELSRQQERLNEINQILANQQLIEYDKYEHTIQEFKKVTLLEETIEIAKYIDELFKLNRDYQQQTRILIQDQDYQSKKANNIIIMESINIITEIQLQNQIINGNLKTITTNSFNISTQKATQKLLQDLISSTLTEPQSIGQKDDKQESTMDTYSYKMVNYQTNPFMYDNYFMESPENQNNYSLYQPEIRQLSNQILIQNISTSQGIRYEFEKQAENLFVECVTKVEDSWSLDACRTINDGKKTICQCQYISSTTIFQATQQIFDQAVEFFSLETIHSMLRCQYQSIIFTYIVIIYTILFLWFIFYGFRMDQTKNDEFLFNSTKVAPADWDFVTEKNGGIINMGEMDSEKRIPPIDRIVIRRETQKKTIFSSNESQITYDDKVLKRPQFEYYNKMLASKKSIGITTNVCSGRIIEETEGEASSPKSKSANSPNVKIAPSESTFRKQLTNDEESLYKKYSTQSITLCKALLFYVEINHKVLSLYYLYDKDCSRVYRTIMLYVSLLGEISILTFFGQIINLNTIIALSILQALFGVIYKKLLQVFLKSEKLCINYIGFNLAILSVLFFLFIIFGSVAKYQSVLEASLWGVAYMSSFILDYVVYTNIQILLFFTIIVKFGKSVTLKKYLKLFLNDKVFIQTFGNS